MNTESTQSVWYRTGKGSHRHASWACANNKRHIDTGSVLETDEDLPFCADCTDAETVASRTAKPETAHCAGSGSSFKNPKLMRAACPVCGKVLKGRGPVPTHK